jgi:hypothetical protein
MFPSLSFELRFFERACQFNGIYTCKAGVVIDDRTGHYFGDRGG